MTIEWSAFPSAGEVKVGTEIVGLTVADVNARFNFPGTGIKDSDGAYLLRYFPSIGPAMNYIAITSAESGDPAVVAAAGGDINVGLQLEAQGDGDIFLVTSSGGIVRFSGTSATRLPTGTTAQRPTGNAGYIRYNTDGGLFEYYSTATSDWQYFVTSTGTVLSITGTANQITASSPTGNVVLSIPNPFIIGAISCTSATVTTGNLTVSLGNIVVTAGTVTASSFIGAATVASTVTIANDVANATDYLIFTNGATGAQALKSTAGITVNPSTNTITATNFSGNATSATLASTVTLANDVANATDYLTFSNGATGAQALKTVATVTVNPSTGTITATNFSGTTTVASTVTLANDAANATDYLVFANTATGNQALKTNTGITVNPSTSTITATTFSGTATNVTLANDTANTSDYLVFTNAATGSQALKSNASVRVNPSTGTVSATVFTGKVTNAADGGASRYLMVTDVYGGNGAPLTNNTLTWDGTTGILSAPLLNLNGTTIGAGNNNQYKNLLINSGFTVNQRAYVSGTALGTNGYGHDKWYRASGAGATNYTFTQLAAGVPIQITITGSAGAVIATTIEGCLITKTGTYVLSWTGTADAAINGGFSSGSPQTVTLTAGVDAYITWSNNNSTLFKPQLEYGSVPTSYEDRFYPLERQLCYRYFFRTPGGFSITGQGDATLNWSASAASLNDCGNITYQSFKYPVEMRTTPSITIGLVGGFARISVNGNFAGGGQQTAAAIVNQGNAQYFVGYSANFAGIGILFSRIYEVNNILDFSADLTI